MIFSSPQQFSPVPMPRIPSSMPHLEPRVFNEQFYNASGSGIAELGKRIGAENVMPQRPFEQAMLQALDNVSAHQRYHQRLVEQAILDPESVNIEDITMAQARARMSLDISRTILNRVVQAWRDLINTR